MTQPQRECQVWVWVQYASRAFFVASVTLQNSCVCWQ
jgi:hypothetical protein